MDGGEAAQKSTVASDLDIDKEASTAVDETAHTSAETFEELGLPSELLEGLHKDMNFARPHRPGPHWERQVDLLHRGDARKG